MCWGVKKWVTSKCSKNWKASLLSLLLLLYPHQWWGWIELASRLNDINKALLETSLSGSNLSKDIYVFAIQSHGLLGDLKWNHTHGWLYWWFTFTANSLSSGALLSLISLQQATYCEVMYWSQQSVSLCWEHCFNVMMPKAQKALFPHSEMVPWTFLFRFHQGAQTGLI